MRIAIYGKGGIGKSTISSNLSFSLSSLGKKVLQIGCDPKADSTRSLLKGKAQRTVTEYMMDVPPSRRDLKDVVNIGAGGVMCIEAGGPRPGVGCAGKGIVGMFQTLSKMDVESLGHDFTIYDVLGDVVCGGFAVPMRPEYSDAIIIVTSGEYMSLFAANNILKGSLSFEESRGRIIGIVLNRRGIDGEDRLVESFSESAGIPIICRVGRSEIFRAAESEGLTVSEMYPGSDESKSFRELASLLISFDAGRCVSPTPLTDSQLDRLYSAGALGERGSFESEENKSGQKSAPAAVRPRRIGKGPVSAVLEGAKVSDIPVVIHGTDSCGYTMLSEISSERIKHHSHDKEAFVPSGDNIVCSSMTACSAIFGGNQNLRDVLAPLAEENDVVLVISTCLPGMIGDDAKRVIDEIADGNPGKIILYVDANRVDSGFDAHIEVIRALSELIDTGIEPMKHCVNVIDDTFIELNKGRNRRYVDSLVSELGLISGPGFLSDCSVRNIIGLRRFGTAVLGDGRRDNLIVKEILESKGIEFMELPLPKGIEETARWIESLSGITGEDYSAAVSRIASEFGSAAARYSPDLEGKSICIVSWDPKEDAWMADALSECGCSIQFRSLGPKSDVRYDVRTDCSMKSVAEAIDAGSFDAVIDMTDSLGNGLRIDSCYTHRSSIDAMRSVWKYLKSSHKQGWKMWGE